MKNGTAKFPNESAYGWIFRSWWKIEKIVAVFLVDADPTTSLLVSVFFFPFLSSRGYSEHIGSYIVTSECGAAGEFSSSSRFTRCVDALNWWLAVSQTSVFVCA